MSASAEYAICGFVDPDTPHEGAGDPGVRAVFVGHGQSTGNVGVPAENLALIELTDIGRA